MNQNKQRIHRTGQSNYESHRLKNEEEVDEEGRWVEEFEGGGVGGSGGCTEEEIWDVEGRVQVVVSWGLQV